MGHESWTACLAVTNNTNTTYWPIIRKHLTFKNGVPTSGTADAIEFGMCYAAAVNASDLMVRWGARSMPKLREGGPKDPPRQPLGQNDLKMGQSCARAATARPASAASHAAADAAAGGRTPF